jgi:hypothetical protein
MFGWENHYDPATDRCYVRIGYTHKGAKPPEEGPVPNVVEIGFLAQPAC